MLPFVLILALIWGIAFALFLHYVPIGRFIVVKYTWLAVVIGIGVDMALALVILPLPQWLIVVGIITASSFGLIGRSIAMDSEESDRLMGVLNDPKTERRQ